MVAKSNVFSFSFTTRKKVRFRKPIVITFNFNAVSVFVTPLTLFRMERGKMGPTNFSTPIATLM